MEKIINATTSLVYEEHTKKDARVWVVVKHDGQTYNNVHLSGPLNDVKDYFEGRLAFRDIERLWGINEN